MRRLLITMLLALGCGNDVDLEPAGMSERFPRLTHSQWESTVRDLFHLPAETGLSAGFTPDPQLGRFDNNIARLGVSSGLWRDYQRAAEAVAESVVADPAIYAGLVPAPTDARSFVTTFGQRAFRRPLGEAETLRFVAVFEGAAALFPDQEPFAAGVRLVVQSMLQSPFFLYRAELATGGGFAGTPLGGYEIASRLSYLLWNSMPDDELFAAARAGDLGSAGGVRAQAERMFEDPRTRAQIRRFHFQAFKVGEYRDLDKNQDLFPDWRPELGAMYQEEASRFLESVVVNDGGVAEILTSTKAYVNADLARIYGIPGVVGDELQEVTLDAATRAGFLTRVGFLARNATLRDPDPIHRGVFINLDVLCRTIAAPPDLPEDLELVGDTNRERITSITGEGTCGAGCHHTTINPLGFAFENYDAIGAYRATDNGFPVDSAATYQFADGRTITFTNAVDLSQQLAKSPEVHACYAKQLLEFVVGRDMTRHDRRLINDLAQRSLDDDLSIKEIVFGIVTSRAFLVRTDVIGGEP